MSITDELREYARIHQPYKSELYNAQCADEITAIADRIDTEHERRMEERADRYAELRASLKERYVELPKDADNVPWNVGDRDEDGNVVTELRLTYDGCWFVITDGEWPYRPKRKRHYHDHHAPNVEDVLCDLLNEYRENECTLEEARLSEYAAKLRLVEGED